MFLDLNYCSRRRTRTANSYSQSTYVTNYTTPAIILAPREGFEPPTFDFGDRYSTN